ncbi:hypothetical protein BRD56_09370 [Thermoplasmatales archaeon SW_10_69_26]|nr:MAG: hypothetical protein BRD56_09370 [Thermoplasmatales archaeon SW_10_69_26]
MSYVDVGTHRLWVTEKGRGSPVVLLHPLFLDSRVFERVAGDLVEEHRVLAVDVRDHGRSQGPPRSWTLREAAGEVEQAVRELEGRPAHVVGLSMGGMIGLRWALAHPDSVRSLALLSTSADEEPHAWLHQAMAEMVRVGGWPATQLLLPYATRRMFSEATQDSAEADVWRQRIAAMDPGALHRAGQAVFGRDAIVDRVGSIQAPALVGVAEQDEAVPPDHGRRLAEALPEAELAELPARGHLLPVEAPQALSEALVHFLRRAEARTTAGGAAGEGSG